jgi:hypothetical protein
MPIDSKDAFVAKGGYQYDFFAIPGGEPPYMAMLFKPGAIIPASRSAAHSTDFITALSAPPGMRVKRPVRRSIRIRVMPACLARESTSTVWRAHPSMMSASMVRWGRFRDTSIPPEPYGRRSCRSPDARQGRTARRSRSRRAICGIRQRDGARSICR